MPPRGFAERICRDSYPGAAIALFAKKSPFTRGYIRMQEIPAVNTIGGPVSDARLTFGEEVIILRHRSGGSGKSGMQVSGMGGYDVLRWDGTCATLAEHELVTWVPGVPRHAPIVWKYLDTPVQEALLSDTRIQAARDVHRKECQGGSLGTASKQCQRATDRLNERIVIAVRTGLDVPVPEKLP